MEIPSLPEDARTGDLKPADSGRNGRAVLSSTRIHRLWRAGGPTHAKSALPTTDNQTIESGGDSTGVPNNPLF